MTPAAKRKSTRSKPSPPNLPARPRASADLQAYINLSLVWTPRPIRDDAEQQTAMSAIEKLVLRPEGSLTPRVQSYLEAATAFLEIYDRRHSSIPQTRGTVTERLNYLVQQAGMSVTNLGKIVGSQAAASYLLSGQRTPSKSQIPKLATHFKTSPAYFL